MDTVMLYCIQAILIQTIVFFVGFAFFFSDSPPLLSLLLSVFHMVFFIICLFLLRAPRVLSLSTTSAYYLLFWKGTTCGILEIVSIHLSPNTNTHHHTVSASRYHGLMLMVSCSGDGIDLASR